MYFRKVGYAVCVLCLVCFLPGILKAQNTSNKGKDFWLGYGNHVQVYSGSTHQMSVYITSDVNTTGTLEIPGINYTTNFTVTANSITTVQIPQTATIPGGTGNNGNGIYNRGIHITSAKDIVVYAHIYFLSVSGATLVLPTQTLGKDYISINYTQVSNMPNSFSWFFVVAVEDNTQVEIIPSVDTQGSNDGKPGWAAGSKNIVNLKRGEIYQVLGKQTSVTGTVYNGNDLTGSRVRSISTTAEPCKRIAVFSGSGKVGIGYTYGNPGNGSPYAFSSDNLIQQVYPTAAWGRKFVTAPLKSRSYDVFRIVKSDPSANVTLNGSQIPNSSFSGGVYYDFNSSTPNVVESDKPIQLVQYAVTSGRSTSPTPSYSEQNGDPEMIYLNPVEQTLTNITMYSTDKYMIREHYLNVVMKTVDVPSFKLDNVSKSAEFKTFSGSGEYSIAQITVNAGTHNLTANGGFNAIAYGFGNAESYGYSAGANVKSLGIEAKSEVSNKLSANGCVNEPFSFRVSLSYIPTKLTWNMGNGSPAIVINNPSPDSTFQESGKTYNVYKLKQSVSYNTAGQYKVQVTAERVASECGSAELIEFDFSALEPPVPKFTAPAEACLGTEIQFTDQTDGKGSAVTSWKWDFGDGTPFSNLQNPKHTYAVTGSYTVKLTVTNATSCSPVTYQQTVAVLKLPVAGFTQQTTTCAPPVVRFTNTSTSANGVITSWIWDYGDGIKETRTSSGAFDHTYPSSGTYMVKLVVQTDKGCPSDTLKKAINVSPSPLVAFVLPEICLKDAFAQFMDQSTISDGSASLFTYLWDFGDGTTSTARNPQHKYSAAKIYQVSLTVTSNSGCSSTVQKDFTVNGAVPLPDFTVQNMANLCSNKQVTFINKSSVDFGSLAKLIWDFGDKSSNLTDEDPSTEKKYTHMYPSSATDKSYIVKLQVFSGGQCFDEKSITITVQGVPHAIFTGVSSVCLSQSSFQITQVGEANGLSGSGKFSGPGVSSTGLFSPATAGTGTHTIKYVFTATSGCADSLTQQIVVYPMPTVNAGRDTVMLEGGRVKLNAKASGNILTYKWTPSTGLDRDDIANPVATPAENITYTLTVTTDKGCSASDAIFVKVLKSPEIPNTFTPNSDGVNDFWEIKYLNSYPGCMVTIFNRYGMKVFSSVGYPEAWNGKMNGGNDLPTGTYYYIVDPKNGRRKFSGSVTIIR